MHPSAATVPLVAPGGLCTWLHLAVGEQLVFVGYRQKGEGLEGAGETLVGSLGENGGLSAESLEWNCFWMKEGDDL